MTTALQFSILCLFHNGFLYDGWEWPGFWKPIQRERFQWSSMKASGWRTLMLSQRSLKRHTHRLLLWPLRTRLLCTFLPMAWCEPWNRKWCFRCSLTRVSTRKGKRWTHGTRLWTWSLCLIVLLQTDWWDENHPHLIVCWIACRGSKIFSSFVKFLKSKDPSDGSEEALVEELKTLNEYLKTNVSIWKCSDHLSSFKLVACTA